LLPGQHDSDGEDVIACIRTSQLIFGPNAILGTSSRVAQSCYSVIGDKPFLWSKPKFDPP